MEIDRLSGATIFSILDPKSEYHQAKLVEKYIDKTSFSRERGHLEFERMLFGQKGASLTY